MRKPEKVEEDNSSQSDNTMSLTVLKKEEQDKLSATQEQRVYYKPFYTPGPRNNAYVYG